MNPDHETSNGGTSHHQDDRRWGIISLCLIFLVVGMALGKILS